MHLCIQIFFFFDIGSKIAFSLSGNHLYPLSHIAELVVAVDCHIVYSSTFCIIRIIIGERDIQ